jgi:hypothetical protein
VSIRTRWHRQAVILFVAAAAVLISITTIRFVVRANIFGGPGPAIRVPPAMAEQGTSAGGPGQRRLAWQSQADKMRRKLGLRYSVPGREVLTMTGILAVEGRQHQVRIVRVQVEEGEEVSIAVDGGQQKLRWDVQDGAKSNTTAAFGSERSLIERIVLDSADQFVLAQLRGVGYYTVAERVRPSDAPVQGYSGQLWTVVRLTEPADTTYSKSLSERRLYFINETNGLIDKVSSVEDGQVIVADLTEWTAVTGEMVPRRISWSRNKQIVMQLELTTVGHGPKQ